MIPLRPFIFLFSIIITVQTLMGQSSTENKQPLIENLSIENTHFEILSIGNTKLDKSEEPVFVKLVAEKNSIAPGEIFTIAVVFSIPKHSHIYWINPGESGLPTTIIWTLPQGFKVDRVQWPIPKIFEFEGSVNYGYDGQAIVLVDIAAPSSIPTDLSILLKAHITWLSCSDICIPGEINLSLELPVASSFFDSNPSASTIPHLPLSDSEKRQPASIEALHKKLFEEARLLLPRSSTDFSAQAYIEENDLFLYFYFHNQTQNTINQIYFFSDQPRVNASAPQKLTHYADGFLLQLPLKNAPISMILSGVLYNSKGWPVPDTPQGLIVQSPISSEKPQKSDLDLSTTQYQANRSHPMVSWTSGGFNPLQKSLISSLFFAFIGGLILNLMPCVFPVISLKILSFVQLGRAKESKYHGLIFFAGILVSFWMLSGLLILLRSAGKELGWGFQLQSPGFVVFLIILLFLIGLNFYGVFELGLSWIGFGSNLTAKTDFYGSFFSGILATIVATPCTAPFMGTAIGFALTQPAFSSILIFTSLATGMASPYVILSFNPSWLNRLPKAGSWMDSLKQGLSFLIFATVIWLLWVFGLQSNIHALTQVLLGLLAITIAAWIYGRWVSQPIVKSRRILPVFFMILFFCTGFFLAHKAIRFSQPKLKIESMSLLPSLSSPSEQIYSNDKDFSADSFSKTDPSKADWQPFSPEKLSALLKAGNPVFINFTAAWCLTCQVNQQTTLDREIVMRAFHEKGVITLKADWTQQNPVITEALESLGRTGVPLYVLYSPNPNAPPMILPTILTPSTLLKALEAITSEKKEVHE